MFDLSGKRALVTGASGGIGREVAKALGGAAARLHRAMQFIHQQSEKSNPRVTEARERLSEHMGPWTRTTRGQRATNLTQRVLPSPNGPRLIVQYDYRYPLFSGVFMTSSFQLESSLSFLDTMKASLPENR